MFFTNALYRYFILYNAFGLTGLYDHRKLFGFRRRKQLRGILLASGNEFNRRCCGGIEKDDRTIGVNNSNTGFCHRTNRGSFLTATLLVRAFRWISLPIKTALTSQWPCASRADAISAGNWDATARAAAYQKAKIRRFWCHEIGSIMLVITFKAVQPFLLFSIEQVHEFGLFVVKTYSILSG